MIKKVVVLGGGTGLSALLKGIKYIKNIEISAIVTVADSGGSTGMLRKHFNIPAVGDLRKVIAALSHHREELEESMEYRINGTNTDLDGHTIGNLILMSQILMKKDFANGIEAATKMLNVSGAIIPVSNHPDELYAELDNGQVIKGESEIGHAQAPIKRVFYPRAEASPQAIKAILAADFIILGIGSLYTSLIANLIYPEIKAALQKTQAQKIYFANIFTQHGETDRLSLKDHVDAIEEHTSAELIDRVITSNTELSRQAQDDYEQDQQFLLKQDYPQAEAYDLVSEVTNIKTGNLEVRHDALKIQKVMTRILHETT